MLSSWEKQRVEGQTTAQPEEEAVRSKQRALPRVGLLAFSLLSSSDKAAAYRPACGSLHTKCSVVRVRPKINAPSPRVGRVTFPGPVFCEWKGLSWPGASLAHLFPPSLPPSTAELSNLPPVFLQDHVQPTPPPRQG